MERGARIAVSAGNASLTAPEELRHRSIAQIEVVCRLQAGDRGERDHSARGNSIQGESQSQVPAGGVSQNNQSVRLRQYCSRRIETGQDIVISAAPPSAGIPYPSVLET